MIRVILVDDHQVLIDGMSSLLKSNTSIEIVGSANNGEQCLDLLKGIVTDVILMDISMPIMDGIEATKHIKRKYKSTEVIALTTHSEPGFVQQMLDYGAKGYLLKNCSESEMVRAIIDVHEGKTCIPEEVKSKLKSFESDHPKILKISKRERQVLQLIAEEYTTQEIADTLFVSPSTVESHRRHLLIKLDAKNAAGLVKRAFELNLL